MARIVNRIKLVDYGDFYKWEIDHKHCRITTEGFNSITAGLQILKSNLYFNKLKTERGKKVTGE